MDENQTPLTRLQEARKRKWISREITREKWKTNVTGGRMDTKHPHWETYFQKMENQNGKQK